MFVEASPECLIVRYRLTFFSWLLVSCLATVLAMPLVAIIASETPLPAAGAFAAIWGVFHAVGYAMGSSGLRSMIQAVG